VQSTVKGLKRKGEKNKGTRHGLIFFSCIKTIKKMLRSKCVRSFCKYMSKSLWFRPKSNIYNINNNIKLT